MSRENYLLKLTNATDKSAEYIMASQITRLKENVSKEGSVVTTDVFVVGSDKAVCTVTQRALDIQKMGRTFGCMAIVE